MDLPVILLILSPQIMLLKKECQDHNDLVTGYEI